ncbi:MAG TPA: hypothetical protein VMS76_04795, partial [Planctomycetota bacterium]|nr:hypothetical protein [Planctomycetota bacterium]
MKLTTWIYAFFALTVLCGVAFLVLGGSMRDSAELLALARSHAEGPGRDPRLALAEIEAALRSAQAEGDTERVAEALELRGRIFGDLGILGRAYADLETVLERYRPGDRRLSLALAEIDLARGDRAKGLERTAALLAADPGLSGAWSVRGRLLAQVGEEELRSCEVQGAASLAGAAASRARELVAEAAGFDPTDPRRFRATRELAQLFGGRAEPARELLDRIDAAGERIAEARSALASALEGPAGPDPDAIDALLVLLARAGRLDEVALLGFAASAHADVSERGTFLQPLMQALVDTGRPQVAIEIAERCATGDTIFDGSLFKAWIDALYVEKRWNAILPLAGKLCLSSDKAHSQTGWFYMGVAGARLGRWFQAPMALERYIRRDPVEPQPGALTLAYQLLAQCYQHQDRREEERLMLRTALAGDPQGLEHPGIAWYRYSKLLLQLEPSACSELDDALANAARLLPLSSEEILPIWQREGERCLRSSGLDIAEYCESLVAQGLLVPSGPASPYELMRIALVHRARGRT